MTFGVAKLQSAPSADNPRYAAEKERFCISVKHILWPGEANVTFFTAGFTHY